MQEQFPNAEIISDVGSGINFKRKGLKAILESAMCGDKCTVIVAHRDRLARFGFELIEFVLEQNGGRILVLDKSLHSPQSELTNDLLAILTVFSCRMHWLRNYRTKIKEDKALSNSGPKKKD
jgi:predicted site-specific integrase-resolvase